MTVIKVLSNGSVLSRPDVNRPGALAPEEIQKGSYWTLDGNVARVRLSRSSGRLYAELFTGDRFTYERGLILRLKARMTLDQAKEWGAQHGHCAVCGALLTDNKSVAQGIGPTCIKKL
jgi:hypothetical protein